MLIYLYTHSYTKEVFMDIVLPDCPVETTLQLIRDKWKVLTSHLRAMEAAGLVTRTVYPEVPPKVEYNLTETGFSLKPILDSMVTWGTTYKENSI